MVRHGPHRNALPTGFRFKGTIGYWRESNQGAFMAAKYSKASDAKVKKAMEEMKAGTLRSGQSNTKVTKRKQAIAIGLSEARAEGKKVPRKKTSRKKASRKKA
jgi:Family of unknown function (DUF6496)